MWVWPFSVVGYATAGCFWRLKLLNYLCCGGCKTSASLFASACEARISCFAQLRNLRSTSVKLLISLELNMIFA